MIAKLTGKVDSVREDVVILDVSGVGYQVFVTDMAMGHLAGQEEAQLWIHTYVREDQLTLYGFETTAELDFFKLLLSVSGVGPKAALGILTIASVATLKQAILGDDPTILTKVSGIGKRTAERVVLELKNKVKDLPVGEEETPSGEVSEDWEALEALMAMGYSAAQARSALEKVPEEVKGLEERIKLALKNSP
jgi:Holliday junction DNA helicase RuvA